MAQGASIVKKPVMVFLDYQPSSTSQVIACSNLWKGNPVFRKLLFYRNEDLPFRPISWTHVLDSMSNYFKRWHKLLFLWLDDKCLQVSTLMGWRKEWCFRLNDKLVLYIAYSFMLHLVTFARSKLFVSFGDVALGIVLRLF